MATVANSRGTTHPSTVGILFVHGIGEQRQGETLVRFGEPLFEWLRAWINQAFIDRSDDHLVELTRAFVLPPSSPEPSHADVAVRIPSNDGRLLNLVIAESWWATVFAPAAFRDVAPWGIAFLPRAASRIWQRLSLTFYEIVRPFRRMGVAQYLVTVFAIPWLLPVAITLFVAETVVLLVALLLGWLTIAALILLSGIPSFRPLVTWAQLAIANSAGDAYVLMHNPLNFEAMVGRVRADLEWLETRAERVVVVGHSQGSVVAYAALLNHRSLQLAAFVTVGSALNLLEHGHGSRLSRRERISTFLDNHPTLGWTNFWTASDPVAAGPLLDESAARLHESRVDNRASVVRDHSTYADNAEQFVAPLACLLTATAGLDLTDLTPRDASTLEQARQRRTQRVQLLGNVRLSAIGVALFAGLILAGLAGPTPLDLIAPVRSLAAAVGSWLRVPSAISLVVIPFLIAVAIVGAYYRVLVGIWSRWDKAAIGSMNARRSGDRHTRSKLAFQLPSLILPLVNPSLLILAGAPGALDDFTRWGSMVVYATFFSLCSVVLTFLPFPPMEAVGSLIRRFSFSSRSE